MPEPPRPTDPPMVSCAVCLKEAPKSEARICEAEDHALHFCGIECFDQWQRKQADQPGPPSD